jgi:isocitrate dehydrogenase (NAD+)
MSHVVTLYPGDGIGPEVTTAARRVLDTAFPAIEWDVQAVGASALASHGTPIPDGALASVRRTGVALKGPLASTRGSSHGPINIALRNKLGLFAQMRPVRSWPGLRGPSIDLVVVRELTEDFAAGLEFEQRSEQCQALLECVASVSGRQLDRSTALTVRPVSEVATRKFVEFVFSWVERHGRKRVTVAHKATVLRATDGLFLEVSREVAAGHPDLEVDDRLVDTLCADLVRDPGSLDVVMAPFLYGDIISDITAALSGGLGLAPGVNYGTDIAVFEATHGTFPKRAGTDEVNPLAMVLTGAMLLRHLGEHEAANRVTAAVATVLSTSDALTYDLHPDRPTRVIGTSALADRIVEEILREGIPSDSPG